MGTFFHMLKDNKSIGFPRNYIFYDTETDPVKVDNKLTAQKLKLGVVWSVKRAYKEHKQKEDITTFTNNCQFYNFVIGHIEKNRITYIFAHNQHFDFNVIDGFNLFESKGWTLKKFIIDSRIFIVEYRKEKYCVKFIDTYNLFPIPLAELGEQLGLPKLDINFESTSMADLEIYCRRDVEIIKDAVLQFMDFLKVYELCYFKPTIASTAFNIYRHKFAKQPIYIHANPKATKLERLSYRGGRCDCFQIGEYKNDTYYLLDMNSMYAYILKNMKLPYKLITVLKSPVLSDIENNIKDHELIISANITINKPVIGLKRKKLIFPIGTFNCCITTPEIREVLKYGGINDVWQINIYDSAILFDNFIDFFHKIKSNTTKRYSVFIQKRAKRIMNSLYGRFGLSIEPYLPVISNKQKPNCVERYYNLDKCRWKYHITLNNVTYERKPKKEGMDSFVAIPSFVTAYARIRIYDYILLSGLENTYYTDTDSLIVNQAGYDNLMKWIHPTKLGYLKEEVISDYIKINNAKNYQIGYERKLKGIKPNAKLTGLNTYKQVNFLSIKGILKEKLSGSAFTKTVQKELKAKYDKGVVGSNGKVTPIVLNEDPRNPLLDR